ncbi:MAG TPA: FxLYD domain-containing protein [Oscillatoriaceae cyanobacterium]
MLSKHWSRLAFAGSMALTLALVGCGQNGYPNGIDPTTGMPYSSETGYGNGYGSGTGYSDPTSGYGSGYGTGYSDPSSGYGTGYGTGTGYSDPTSGYGSGYGTGYGTGYPTNYPASAQLTVQGVSKQASGILFWKKLSVSGQVVNNTQTPLSGEVQISFTKGGQVVETKYEFVTNLTPGQTHSFTDASTKTADDAEITVNTEQSTMPNTGYNSGYGTSTGYGTGYGASTGYPSTGTGYGTSY